MVFGLSFRLLNSEIGNDQAIEKYCNSNKLFSFRLLNSEIGNDLEHIVNDFRIWLSFRLLNSEIGNDRETFFIIKTSQQVVFVSLTRR